MVSEVERLDLGFVESEQLAFLADTVLVEVAPDAQVSESAVGRIHLAVAVIIEFFQCLIAVGSTFAIFKEGVVAEKLATVIDDTIAIAVIDEHTIILVYPTSRGTNAVITMVKERAVMAVAGEGFNAIAVKV